MTRELVDMYNMTGTCPEDILLSETKFALRNLADASDVEVNSLQQKLVSFLSRRLLGIRSEKTEGIVLHSGSEANEIGLLLAKRATRRKLVVTSNLTHSSIDNSCNKLDLDILRLEVDRRNFKVSPDSLKDILRSHGQDIALLVITYGTTKLGSEEDFDLDKETIKLLEQHDIGLHVDAAYGGFMLDLMQRNDAVWKRISTLKSITLDTHKFIGTIGCGVLLLPNHKDKEHIGAEAIYFDGNATALGTTRSAYPLATAVATINSLGFDGLQELAIEAQTKASQLAEKIESVGLKLIAPIITGVVPVELSSFEEVNYYKHQLINEGYKISPINIPFTDGNLFGFRVVVTPKPSMTNTMLDSFVVSLEKVVANSNRPLVAATET